MNDLETKLQRPSLTGLVVAKHDGTSKGGMVVAIQKELGLPVKFIGLGEQPDDLQPFDAKQFALAPFEEQPAPAFERVGFPERTAFNIIPRCDWRAVSF